MRGGELVRVDEGRSRGSTAPRRGGSRRDRLALDPRPRYRPREPGAGRAGRALPGRGARRRGRDRRRRARRRSWRPGSSPASTASSSTRRRRSSAAWRSSSSSRTATTTCRSSPLPTDARPTAEAERGRARRALRGRDGARATAWPSSTTRSPERPRRSLGMSEAEKLEALDAHPAIGATGLSARSAAEQGADDDPARAGRARAAEQRRTRSVTASASSSSSTGGRSGRSSRCCASRLPRSREEELETALGELVAIARDRWRQG